MLNLDTSMRVFFISIAVLVILGLGLFGVRHWGLMTPYQKFEHAFLSSEAPPHEAVKVFTLAEARSAVAASPKIIFWVDLRMSADGKFLVLDPETSSRAITLEAIGMERWKGNALSRYSLEELRLLFPEAPLFEDFLAGTPPAQRMILNIVDNAADVHTKLIALLEGKSPEKRFLFQSETDVVLKSLKDKEPLWLFGTSRADLMKILTFESMGLEPASPFRGDVFISPFQVSGREAFNQGVLDEIRRRHKEIFIGPLENAADLEKAKTFRPDGFIFRSVETLQKIKNPN